MGLLQGQKVDESVMRAVKKELDMHAAKARGLEMGRKAAREAAKQAADDSKIKIAKLQEAIKASENARAMDAANHKSFKATILKGWQDH